MTWTPPTTGQWNPSIIKTVEAPTEIEFDAQGGPVKAWSASALDIFEKCRYHTYLKRVKRIAEPSGEAADRGSMIHDLAEHYVDGSLGELPEQLEKFEKAFKSLREQYIAGKVELEEDWGFDINWQPCGWMDKKVWARIKLDVFVHEDETSAKVIDHKTGRKFGNEIKHNQQAMIYAIAAFMRYPDLEYIETEFWYLDKGEYLRNHYTRKQLPILMPRLEKRAIAMTCCTDFPPKPSATACKWCHYNKSGDCDWGFQA